ncbi:MAG TPA: DUF2207 domain-containing protein [Longimicrobium sp.]|nr:DUF2207 domain-containing protein [Longimicrobium sp.]
MRRILAALATLATLLFAAHSAAAQGRAITLTDYAVDVVIRRDGTADVTEVIRARFDGTWNGIFRDIALKHETGQGRRSKLDIDDVRVTDIQGQGLEFWDESGDNGARRIRVRVPGASDATRTVMIHYRVLNGVRHFFPEDQGGEHDELYWNATGNGWAFPIEHAVARITLPEGMTPTQQHAYTGYEGSNASDATVSVRGSTVHAETTRPLAAGEGLTLAVAFPAGVLPRPTRAELRRQEAAGNWPLALPLIAFVLMFRRWHRVGRDPRELPAVVCYDPPDGMSPAELGTLVDNCADLKDVTSTLIDLAVRGYIGIEEVETKHVFGLFSSNEWVFHLRNPSTDGLLEHERLFLSALFAGASEGPAWSAVREGARAGATDATDASYAGAGYGDGDTAVATQPFVRMSELKHKFYRSIPGLQNAVYDRLIERGYYLKRPDKVKGAWAGFGIVVMILGGIAAGFLGDSGMPIFRTIPLAIGGIGTGVIIFGFGLAMAARTVKGARARESALGFREFLSKVESDRYRMMITSPELFERFLPHAMAFGVEGRWARAFEDLYRQPPDWYSGSHYHNFSTGSFTSHMSAFSTTAASTMSSSPSGSSGGGSSGGGSGGGGGGGW